MSAIKIQRRGIIGPMIVKNMNDVDLALARFIRVVPKLPYRLDEIKALLTYLDNPQDKIRVIHVAGTSGKTSTAYYGAVLLRGAGKTVGLSVSPHIYDVRERTQVNGQLLDEQEYCELLGRFLVMVQDSGIDVTYFELLVAFSFWVWVQKGIEWAVVEVGLGGLLDGTNVVTRADKISVITDIGYDHQEVLGDTLAEIAAQKAGIILPTSYVFVHEQPEEVMSVFRNVAHTQGAILNVVEETTVENGERLPLFQQRNLSLAFAAVTYGLGMEPPLEQALEFRVPGRMEELLYNGKRVFLDGSHNAQKIGALVEAFRQQYPELRPLLVVSFGKNREPYIEEGLGLLRELGDRLVATSFDNQQDTRHESLPPERIVATAQQLGFREIQVVPGVLTALEHATNSDAPAILVVGSFYALSEIRSVIAP